MSGHTPGPWAIGKGYGRHGVDVVGDDGNRAVAGVIGVWKDTHDRDGRFTGIKKVPEGCANLQLIAAAPDLLNALTVLADAAEARGIPCDAARAAIAKATGGAE